MARLWIGVVLSALILRGNALSAQDTTKTRVTPRAPAPVRGARLAPKPAVAPTSSPTSPPAPALPPGESIDTAWERSGEGPRGLWTVEVLQKGVGTSVGLTAHCPAGTIAIGAGIENSSMTPFAVWQSYPKTTPVPGWYILMHRNMVPAIDGGNPYPPTPYTFFMTARCIDSAVWGRAMSAPTSP